MIVVEHAEAGVVGMQTRLPFRYGIAEMTVTPHAVVTARVRVDGHLVEGYAADHLPPKWFTKDPGASYAEELVGLVDVVLAACAAAPEQAPGQDAFTWWSRLAESQRTWADRLGVPLLLAGLGVALVERAVIDALCRHWGTTFGEALRAGRFGLDLGSVHPELSGRDPAGLLPDQSRHGVAIRHTVGLGDALTRDDQHDAVDDDLPVTLDEVLDRHGTTHVKVKVDGDADADQNRLARILDLFADRRRRPTLTLDGNERFTSAEDFEAYWDEVMADPTMRESLSAGLVAIEQPFARAAALDDDVASLLRRRADLPPLVVDESDAWTTSVREAMDIGYAGGTYKGCKGVFRGVANACLIAHRRSRSGVGLLTAEDLSTVPPLTLMQDLAVVSALGLDHVERNGHHFFGRPAPLGPDVPRQLLDGHPDLFATIDGATRLLVRDGEVSTASVVAAPFGLGPAPDTRDVQPLTLATARGFVA